MLITRKYSITTERAEEETTPAPHHTRRAVVRAALLAVPRERLVPFAVSLFAHLRASGAERAATEAQARALLSAERPALNFLQLLSATATLTRAHVDAIAGATKSLKIGRAHV